MALKHYLTDFKDLGTNDSIRLWLPFVLPKLKYDYDKLTNFLSLYETGNRPKGGINDEDFGEAISLGGEQIGSDGQLNLSKIPYVPFEYYESVSKGKVVDQDILICKDGALTGKSCYVDFNLFPSKEVMVNEHVFIFRANKRIIQNFLYYLTRSNLFQAQVKDIAYRKKAQPGLSADHLKKLKLPIIDIEIQENSIKRIHPIENFIIELKSKVLSPQAIIDKVFANHFGFDIENADKKKKELVHYANLEDLANEELKFDISLKYRYIFLNYIKKVSKIEWIELGKLVEVKGGKRLPKGQNITEEETDYKYIRVDDLSWSGIFDLDNIKYISEENHKAIKNYIANENDILLTIVGATVGKCGLVPAELDGENITENFARLIIKDKDNYLPEYVNYCLQSKTSVYQIDEYKGRGSQGKLALFRIKKIKMPKISKQQQKEIVDEIKTELDKQELLKQQITTEKNKIDKIIEECIMTIQ